MIRTHLGTALLAHQGGWDETLFVAGPISLFAFLLYLANRKAQAQLDAQQAAQELAEASAPDGEPDADGTPTEP